MKLIGIIILLLSFAGCSNNAEEILGAWKTEEPLLGKPSTLIFEKNRVTIDASSENPQIINSEYEKHNGIISIFSKDDKDKVYIVKIIDKDHISFSNTSEGDDYMRTTLEDIEAIKKAPGMPSFRCH